MLSRDCHNLDRAARSICFPPDGRMWGIGLLVALSLLIGCNSWRLNDSATKREPLFDSVATRIEYPNVQVPLDDERFAEPPPRTFRDTEVTYWDLNLDEAIRLALGNSDVLRNFGAAVIRSPEAVSTPHDPAIQETDPLFGVPAALSAFDANLAVDLFTEKNDRRVNNVLVGEDGFFEQDLSTLSARISKHAATGTRFTVGQWTEFDHNNTKGNEFDGGAWTVQYEAEARHPLLRGGGVTFNRIAGPNGAPGNINGVVIARIRTDISLAKFEIEVRNYLANVENAYWDLYFAYRDLDTKVRARDAALHTWRQIYALYQAEHRGGEAAREAQAREQVFRFEEDVQEALVGRLLDRTNTFNGSTPGTFQGLPGVHVAERRLRLLIGLPVNGTQLIRPSDEPADAPVVYDWASIRHEALTKREELRQQRWKVKRREMEMIAAKNFLKPSLDLVGRYRWRGFGEGLIGPGDGPRFSNAYADLTSGDFQEPQIGIELNVPIGFRQGRVALRNVEYYLMRERSILREQERQVLHDLSNSVGEAARALVVLQIAFSRVEAAKVQVREVADAYDRAEVDLFVLLDAQRRLADAESNYFRRRVEHALAIRNIQFEKGSLLQYCRVQLAEGPWPLKAYRDAADREYYRGRQIRPDLRPNDPPIVSAGVPLHQQCPPPVSRDTISHHSINPEMPGRLQPGLR